MYQDIPVILDCYADWCAPCKKLEPILVKKIKKFNGIVDEEEEGSSKEEQEDVGEANPIGTETAERLKMRLVKLNIDNLPTLSNQLQIRSIPAVFLIYKGNIVDMFQGVPTEKTLDQFFETALLLNRMSNDKDIMANVFSDLEAMINENKLENALNVVRDSMKMEEWKANYEAHMILIEAYCLLFTAKQGEKYVDTIPVRKSLEQLTEEKMNDLPDFYLNLASEVDAELLRLEHQQAPDEQENLLRTKLEESIEQDSKGKPDLTTMFELGEYLSNKNKFEEAIDLLLDIVAIERNWEERKAQTLLQTIFKKLGPQNDLTVKGRKKLSKLLF
uniref:Thioredoxin domain-containing protein n=1 Tax=Strombidium rassoulzadegani TaxID=1082188 RepID=A0A7S3FT30_9SPIT|mmetsp:Transcript_13239/g.22468  ORF Transcript_13239/g.22468 Transcript_13239/m.22468 type:complete len:331 (+) Transcript_13239:348-1340(+)